MNLPELPLEYLWQPSLDLKDPTEGHLMVVLHGRGDSPEGFSWLGGALAIPKVSYLMLQAPNDYFGGYSWYDMPPNQLPGIQSSSAKLALVFTELERADFKMNRTFLLGFSQGCLMTLEFGARFEKALAGYVGISGYVYDEKKLALEMNPVVNQGNWLVTHGTRDDVLAVERTRAQIQSLKDSGFKIEYHEYAKSHTIDEREEFPLIKNWIQSRIIG